MKSLAITVANQWKMMRHRLVNEKNKDTQICSILAKYMLTWQYQMLNTVGSSEKTNIIKASLQCLIK